MSEIRIGGDANAGGDQAIGDKTTTTTGMSTAKKSGIAGTGITVGGLVVWYFAHRESLIAVKDWFVEALGC